MKPLRIQQSQFIWLMAFQFSNLQQLLFPVCVNKNSPSLCRKWKVFFPHSDTIPGTNARRRELSQEPIARLQARTMSHQPFGIKIETRPLDRNHYTDVRQHRDNPIRPHCCRCGAAKAEPAELPNALKRQAPFKAVGKGEGPARDNSPFHLRAGPTLLQRRRLKEEKLSNGGSLACADASAKGRTDKKKKSSSRPRHWAGSRSKASGGGRTRM